MQTVGTILALVLTLMVYTYLIGDNVLFRLAEHILVGVSVGWAILQIFYGLLLPAWNSLTDGARNGLRGEVFAFLIPLILGVVLLTRPLRASKPLSNLVMAFVVGTIAALSLAGALAGTLLPQVGASLLPLGGDNLFGQIVLLLGTLLSLWYFQFTVFKREGSGETGGGLAVLNNRVRLLGRWSLMLAFGAVFAAVFLTYFAALLDRLVFLINIRF